MPKYEKQKCIHCLKYFDKLTEDHIFPDSWYPESTPSNLEKWTAPSCDTCNKKLGSAEEELFYRLAVCLDENDIAARGLSRKVLNKFLTFTEDRRKFGRQMKLIKDTINNFIPYLYEEGNDKVLKGSTPKEGIRSRLMIRIPNDKLLIVGEKIIRGLEYKLRNRLIEQDRKIDIFVPHANNKNHDELIANWENLIITEEECVTRGPGFIVKYGASPFDENWVIYNIKIWDHIDIWGFIYPKNRRQKKQPNERTKSNTLINEAISLMGKGDIDNATRTIDESIKCDPSNFYAYLSKANLLFQLHKYNDALKAVDEALLLKPKNFKALTLKVSVLGILEKYKESIEVSDIGLRLNVDKYLLYKKGVSLCYLKKYDEAIIALQEFLRFKPNDINGILKLIYSYMLVDKYKESTELFEKSDLPEQNDYILYNNIGYAYLKLKKYSESERLLRKAMVKLEKMETDLDNNVYGNLILLYLEQRKYLKYLLLKFRFIQNIIRIYLKK